MFAIQGDAIAHMGGLLNSLLGISRLEAGDVELNIIEMPVQEIFHRLKKEFENQARAKSLQLNFDAQSEIACSDRFLLTQIVRILVSNAIRYTSKGSVHVFCRREGSALRIIVRDSGIGIAPDQLTGIFDEFYRVDKDPAGRNGSIGLGLSIVERSADLMGTKVEVESELGRGSSFSLLVPAGSATGVRSMQRTEDQAQ